MLHRRAAMRGNGGMDVQIAHSEMMETEEIVCTVDQSAGSAFSPAISAHQSGVR
jgi:hypothetical protein